MSSTFISSTNEPTKVPNARPNYYESPYKWPESEARFSRPIKTARVGGEVKVVDSKSCRQLYVRSAYTFSRAKENKDIDVKEKAKKCLDRVKSKVMRNDSYKDVVIVRKVKHFSCNSLLSILRRMLVCTAKVDVAAH